MHNFYYDDDYITRRVSAGSHRNLIGGTWDKIGTMQIDFLKSRGLQPSHKLLDIGCGSLRLGVKAIEYLEPARYFGTDLRQELMEAGYERELKPLGLEDRLPPDHLVQDICFDFPNIPDDIDFAIAQSVFSHLPFNHIRRCVANLRRFKMLREFCFTVFLAPSIEAVTQPVEQVPGSFTHDWKDSFHYLKDDIDYLVGLYGLSAQVFDWNHPRNQQMVVVKYS